jgi:hypothetical protein
MKLEEFFGDDYLQNCWTGNPDGIGIDIAEELLKTAKELGKFCDVIGQIRRKFVN